MKLAIEKILEELTANEKAAIQNFQKYSECEDFGKWLAYKNAKEIVKTHVPFITQENECYELIQEMHTLIHVFEDEKRMRPTHMILSRNYVDMIKKEYESYDMFLEDTELTFDGLPILIDETTINKVSVGCLLSK